MTWLPERAAGSTAFEQVLGLRPELLADLRTFTTLFETLRPADPELLELCRLRVAQILGADRELRRSWLAAVGAERRAALANWRRSDRFSPLERAALAFSEQFVLDPHGVTDAAAAALTAALSPAEMVALVEALAIFDGFTRVRLILGLEEAGE